MSQPRLPRFNTRDTHPEQALDSDLCQAVVVRPESLVEVDASAVIPDRDRAEEAR